MSSASTSTPHPGLTVKVKRSAAAPKHDFAAFRAMMCDRDDEEAAPAPAQKYPSPPVSDTEAAPRPVKRSAPAIENEAAPRPTKALKRTTSSAALDCPAVNELEQTEFQAASAARRGKKLPGQLTAQVETQRAVSAASTIPSRALKEAIETHGVPLALHPELQGRYTPIEETRRQARYIPGVRGSCASGSAIRPEKTALGFRFPKNRPTRAEVEEAKERNINLSDHRLSRVDALNQSGSRDAQRQEEEAILSAAEILMNKEGGNLSSAIFKVRESRAAARERMPVLSKAKRMTPAAAWPAVYEIDKATGTRALVKPEGIPATVKQWVAAQAQTNSNREAKELCSKWHQERKMARRL